jgi:hypothetical protein
LMTESLPNSRAKFGAADFFMDGTSTSPPGNTGTVSCLQILN